MNYAEERDTWGLAGWWVISSFVPLLRCFTHLGAPILATSLGNATPALPHWQTSTQKTGCKPCYLGSQFAWTLLGNRSSRARGFCCFLHCGKGFFHEAEERPCSKSAALWVFSSSICRTNNVRPAMAVSKSLLLR